MTAVLFAAAVPPGLVSPRRGNRDCGDAVTAVHQLHEPEQDGAPDLIERASVIQAWRSPELEAAMRRPTAEWTGKRQWTRKEHKVYVDQ